MVGVTNAMGVSGPFLSETLNGYNHTLWEELRDYFVPKSMLNNPPVGSVTCYAGFDWLVVHWDTEKNVMYLALKNIYHLASYSDSDNVNVGFKNSIMETEVQEFEQLLKQRVYQSDSDSNSLFNPLHLLEDVEYDGLTCKVFIPTREQMMTEFDLFRTRFTDGYDYGNFGNAIALYQGEPKAWWLAGNGVGALKPCVRKDGYYFQSEATSNLCGFRPFICMKMR